MLGWEIMDTSRLASRAKTIAVLKHETARRIEALRELARHSGWVELCLLTFWLHILRVMHGFKDDWPGLRPEFIQLTGPVIEEALRYAIQMCAKYGNKDVPVNEQGVPRFNYELPGQMVRLANEINALYDLHCFAETIDVTATVRPDGSLSIDIGAAPALPAEKIVRDYLFRLEHESLLSKAPLPAATLIAHLKTEYQPYADLFAAAFGTTVDVFAEFITFLVAKCQGALAGLESKAPRLPDGNVAVGHPTTVLLYAVGTSVPREDVISHFGEEIAPLLHRLSFAPEAFDENQLRYHQVARAPLLPFQDHFIISPELLLDSLFVNSHYSLLEQGTSQREAYKARASEIFLDGVAEHARPYGWTEAARNVVLSDGALSLGDVDLVLRNAVGRFLLIEGKNHALPLDVYFRDPRAIEARLRDEQTSWETKVLARRNHLERHHEKYSIAAPFDYIVVSRFPEIISHHSAILVLSEREFCIWLGRDPMPRTFSEMFQLLYADAGQLTPEELKILQTDGITAIGGLRALVQRK